MAEQYVTQFGNLAKAGNTLIVPAAVSDVASMIATALSAIKQQGGVGGVPPVPHSRG